MAGCSPLPSVVSRTFSFSPCITRLLGLSVLRTTPQMQKGRRSCDRRPLMWCRREGLRLFALVLGNRWLGRFGRVFALGSSRCLDRFDRDLGGVRHVASRGKLLRGERNGFFLEHLLEDVD